MTCESFPASTWPEKHPSETLDYAVDFESVCARHWDRWTDFSAGQRIRVFLPGAASGYEFEATTAGRTGGRSPIWPSSASAIVRDGSVVWTARALSSASLLRSFSGTPIWTASTGITVSSVSAVGLKATANLAGGLHGSDYSVTIAATGSDGLVMIVVGILPVRIPARNCA